MASGRRSPASADHGRVVRQYVRVTGETHLPSDEFAQRLARLADDLETALGDSAVVQCADLRHSDAGAVQTTVIPVRQDALSVTWLDFGNGLQVEAGHNGGRWELSRDLDAVTFIENVARSVVAGRAVEIFGPRRSRVEVTFPDGTVAAETGSQGLVLPLRGWRKRGRRVGYAPYR
jgi:hypothetical protein